MLNKKLRYLAAQQIVCVFVLLNACYKPSSALVQAHPLEGSLII